MPANLTVNGTIPWDVTVGGTSVQKVEVNGQVVWPEKYFRFSAGSAGSGVGYSEGDSFGSITEGTQNYAGLDIYKVLNATGGGIGTTWIMRLEIMGRIKPPEDLFEWFKIVNNSAGGSIGPLESSAASTDEYSVETAPFLNEIVTVWEWSSLGYAFFMSPGDSVSVMLNTR